MSALALLLVASSVRRMTTCRRPWRLVVLAALPLAALAASCHRRVPGVLPSAIQGHQVRALQLMDGQVVRFDKDGARVLSDSVVGFVNGARSAVPVASVRLADVEVFDGIRTTWLALALTLTTVTILAIAVSASGGFGFGGFPGGGAP